MTHNLPVDSPAVPPSAGANQLFRGFSYVAPSAFADFPEVSKKILNQCWFCLGIIFIFYIFEKDGTFYSLSLLCITQGRCKALPRLLYLSTFVF